MSASSPSATTEQPQTIQTWPWNTIETARTKPNFRTYVLSKSSGKTIVALHPIPSEFLQELTHKERVELAIDIDIDIRSAKPKTPQAAVAFALEESIKRICRLGVTKKATGEVVSSKPSETASIGTQTLSRSNTAAVSLSSTTRKTNFAPSKSVLKGPKQIEGRNGIYPPGTPPVVTERAWLYRQDTLFRLRKIEANPYHISRYIGGEISVEQLRKIAASHSSPRHVSFKPNVKYEEYDEDSPPSTKWAAIMAKAPYDDAPTAKPTFAPELSWSGNTSDVNNVPEDVLNEYINEIVSQGCAGLDELEDQLILFQSGLPYAEDDDHSPPVIKALEAISLAHEAIYDAREDGARKRKLIEIAVEATERACNYQEYALRRMNDPSYKLRKDFLNALRNNFNALGEWESQYEIRDPMHHQRERNG